MGILEIVVIIVVFAVCMYGAYKMTTNYTTGMKVLGYVLAALAAYVLLMLLSMIGLGKSRYGRK